MMKPLPDLYFYTRHGLCPCQLTFMAFYHRNRHTNVTHCESLYMMKQSLSTQNIGTASKPSLLFGVIPFSSSAPDSGIWPPRQCDDRHAQSF
jgi:hypothetical protein